MWLDQTDFRIFLLKTENEYVHSVHVLKFIGLIKHNVLEHFYYYYYNISKFSLVKEATI